MSEDKKEVILGEMQMVPVQAGEQDTPSTKAPRKKAAKGVPIFSVFKLKQNATIPSQGTGYSAGYDLTTCINDDAKIDYFHADNTKDLRSVKAHTEHDGKVGFYLEAGARALVPTGLQFQIEPEYWVGIYPRSGTSIKQGIGLANCVGVIDADYTGEVMLTLTNNSRARIFIAHGERYAQAVVHSRVIDLPEVLDEAPQKRIAVTSRAGGFGSTGK